MKVNILNKIGMLSKKDSVCYDISNNGKHAQRW